MGMSVYAKLCFGVQVDHDLPWEQYDEDTGERLWDDEDHWWSEVSGYKPLFELYDANGERIPGFSKEEQEKYWDHCSNFAKEHPMPIEVVRVGYYDDPDFILAVKDTVHTTYYGDIDKVDMNWFNISEEQIKALTDFCAKYKINYEGPPSWLISSYYSH